MAEFWETIVCAKTSTDTRIVIYWLSESTNNIFFPTPHVKVKEKWFIYDCSVPEQLLTLMQICHPTWKTYPYILEIKRVGLVCVGAWLSISTKCQSNDKLKTESRHDANRASALFTTCDSLSAIFVIIALNNDLVPTGTKPSVKPRMIYRQWDQMD